MARNYHLLSTFFVLVFSLASITPTTFGWKEETGYNSLLEKYGNDLPTGTNLKVGMVETDRDGAWAPDPNRSSVSEKNITFEYITPSSYSSHANGVIDRLSGTGSIVPGTPEIGAFRSTMWQYFALGQYSNPPSDLGYDIYNNSWVGLVASGANSTLRRADYIADVFDTTIVAGVDNFETFPVLMANGYNSIAVGRTSGAHSLGGTTFDGTGRMKPDIVGTNTWTSYATPIVSSCAALLLDESKRTPSLQNAKHSEVIKALLLAGATKDEFANWSQSETTPLDPVFGAGEVNILNSYEVLIDGEVSPTFPSSRGWDFNNTSSSTQSYHLSLAEDTPTSIVLTWHRQIEPQNGSWSSISAELPNLDLKLWTADSQFNKQSLIKQSISSIDNVEHIFEEQLAAGSYIIEVIANGETVDYALAWHTSIANESNGASQESVDVSLSGLSNNQTITIGSHTSVDITATGATSNITSVELIESGTTLFTDTSSPYSFTWTPYTLGILTLSAEVKTELGTYSKSVNVNVIDDELSISLTSPTAGSSFSEGDAISLGTEISTDHGTIDHVDFYLGASPIGSDSTYPYSLTWTPTTIGTHSLKAIATNGSGIEFESSSVSINVTPNPIAVSLALSSNSITLGQNVTLTPSFTDSHSTLSSISYYNGSSLIGSANASPYSLNWTPPSSGNFSIKAITTDTYDQSEESNIHSLIVTEPIPESDLIQIAVVGFNAGNYTIGDNDPFQVTVSGNQSPISNIKFYSGDSLLNQEDLSPYDFTFNAHTLGNQNLSILVTTEQGQYPLDLASTTVVDEDLSVSLTGLSDNQSIERNSTIQITADVSTNLGTVNQVAFYADDHLLGADSSAPYSLNWTPDQTKSYNIHAVATNGSNADFSSNIYSIDAYSPIVPVTLSSSSSNIETEETINLNVSYSDPENDLDSVAYLVNGQQIATLNAAPFQTIWTPQSAGTYSIKAISTNISGLSSESQTIEIQVTAPIPESDLIQITVNDLTTQTITVGNSDDFSVSVNGALSNVQSVSFYADNQLISQDSTAPYEFAFAPTTDGAHSLKLITQTEIGSYTTIFAANAQYAPLAIVLSSPSDGLEIVENSPIDIIASVDSTHNQIQSVRFTVNGSTLLTDTLSPFEASWTPALAGTYQIAAIATNGSGIESTSDLSVVTVTEYTPNSIPVSITLSQSQIETGQTISVDATFDDLESSLEKVEFYVGNSLISTHASYPFTFNYTPQIAGSYQLKAVTTNSAGLTAESSFATLAVVDPVLESDLISISFSGLEETLKRGSNDPFQAIVANNQSNILNIKAYENGVFIHQENYFPYDFTFSPQTLGTRTLKLVTTTELGTYETTRAVEVTDGDLNPAITSPAENSSFIEDNAISIAANVSAPNAFVSDLQLLINGQSHQSDATAPFEFQWTPTVPGNYTLQLVATNASGVQYQSSTQSVFITEYIPPVVPVTLSLSESTIEQGESITLSTTTDDPENVLDKTIFTANGSQIGSSPLSNPSLTWSPSEPGAYTLVATTHNTAGQIASSNSLQLTVNEPILESDVIELAIEGLATEDYTIGDQNTVAVTVNEAISSIHSVSLYANGSLISSESAAPYEFQWTADSIGINTFEAIVSTELGQYSKLAGANVVDGSLAVSLDNPSNGYEMIEGETLAISGTVSYSQATVSSVSLSVNGTTIESKSQAPYQFDWTPSSPGSYSLQLKAVNSSNASFLSPLKVVTVNEYIPEAVSLSLSSNESTLTLGDSCLLSLNIQDPDSSLVRIDLYQGDNLLGALTSAPWTYEYTPNAAGIFALSAVSTNTANLESSSNQISVNVEEPVIEGEVINTSIQGFSNSAYRRGESEAITVAITNNVNPVQSVQLYDGNTLIGADSSSPYEFDWTADSLGSRSIKAIVNTSEGEYLAFDTILVTDGELAVAMLLSETEVEEDQTVSVSASITTESGSIANAYLIVDGSVHAADNQAPYDWSFTPSEAGSYNLAVKAINESGEEYESTIQTIVVSSRIPAPASIEISVNNNLIELGESLLITTNISDPENALERVEFYSGSNLIGSSSSNTASLNWTPTTVGEFTVSAKTINSAGIESVSNSISVTVDEPVLESDVIDVSIQVESPATRIGNAIAIEASVSGNLSPVTRVDFTRSGQTFHSDTTSPFTAEWIPNAIGSHALTAFIYTEEGSYSASTNVEVLDGQISIELLSPANGYESEVDQSIEISSNITATNATIYRTSFLINGSIQETSTTSSSGFEWTPTQTGSYSVQINATNLSGETFSSEVSNVTILEPEPDPSEQEAESIAITFERTSPESELRRGNTYSFDLEVSGNQSDIKRVTLKDGFETTESDSLETVQTLEWTPSQSGSQTLIVNIETELETYTRELELDILDGEILVGIGGIANGSLVNVGESRLITSLVYGENANISEVKFYRNDFLVRTDAEAPYEFSWEATAIGASEFYATAENASGETFQSSILTARVETNDQVNSGSSNSVPNSISFKNIVDGQNMPYDEIVDLKVLIERPEEIESVRYYLDNILIAESSQSPFNAKTIFLIAGDLTLTAQAIDENGDEIFTQPLSVTVEQNSEEDPTEEPIQQTFFARDIGEVGKEGATLYSEQNGEFEIQASGDGIWNDSDSFRFVYIPLEGNGSLTIRIRDLREVNSWSKAGLMIRSGLEPESENAALLLNGDGDVSFQFREFIGAETNQASIPFTTSGPIYLKLSREGSLVTSSFSFDGKEWTLVRERKIALTNIAYMGMALSSNSHNRSAIAIIDRIEAEGNLLEYHPETTRPQEIAIENNLWESSDLYARDIGDVAEFGSIQYYEQSDLYSLTATSEDIWGESDQLRLAYIQASGNFEFTARISSLERASNWTKAGIMVRDTLDADSKHASSFINAKGIASFLRRLNTSGSTAYSGVFGVEEPVYLRLIRSGNTFTSQYSLDGSSWTTIGSEEVAIQTNCYLGLALSSANSRKAATATFDQVTVKALE